jgi:hypothetical protein
MGIDAAGEDDTIEARFGGVGVVPSTISCVATWVNADALRPSGALASIVTEGTDATA